MWTPAIIWVAATSIYDWLRFSRRVLLFALQEGIETSSIHKPMPKEVDIYATAVSNLYPVMKEEEVHKAADGIKISIQECWDYIQQNQTSMNGTMDITSIQSLHFG